MSKGVSRPLNADERALARSIFGKAIDYDRVLICASKWIFFQPRRTVMAPMGNIHFHPKGGLYCDDFCTAPLNRQGLFIHEMVHVWQAQTRGRWFLPLMRWPFDRYGYTLKPGWMLGRYGLEQQAEIVRHYFLLKRGHVVAGAPGLEAYRAILPYDWAD